MPSFRPSGLRKNILFQKSIDNFSKFHKIKIGITLEIKTFCDDVDKTNRDQSDIDDTKLLN